jgi:hypothetical protein
MLELAAFTAALSSVGALIKVANESKNLELTSSLIELQQKILNMQGSFGELQQKYHEAQEQTRRLGDELRQLSDASALANDIVAEDNAYFLNKEGNKSGPYCTACWDRDRKLVRLSFQGPCTFPGKYGFNEYICAVHGKLTVYMKGLYN